jgi:hypothetical protein
MNDELKDSRSHFIVPTSSFRSRCFLHLARFDTGRADLHADVPALRSLNANLLQVGIETPPGAVVRVRDVVAELRAFAADFASFCHDCFELPPNVEPSRA